ncbi:MAG TPA: ABC transporter permease [Nonomuraea sp.]|nr:ABC transporter permease [Nonomuraea sp.]
MRLRLNAILQELAPLLALVLLAVLLTILSPVFLTTGNFLNVGRQAAINAILASGMTFVILTAGIDLSVGSLVSLTTVIFAVLHINFGPPWPVTLLICLIATTSLGLVNGLAVSRLGFPPFIMTLGMLNIALGLALVLSGGRPEAGFPKAFTFFGSGAIYGIPVPIFIVLIIYTIAWLVLTRTRFGRHVYAVGGNKEAARLSGVNVRRVEMLVYVISGFTAALAGLVFTARLDSGTPNAGVGNELDAIAAVVIGGTSLFGGQGGIWGSLIGALIMAVLRNGLNLLNVNNLWQAVFIGAVIIIAVGIDLIRKRRAAVA